jgi:hypothetical protein
VTSPATQTSADAIAPANLDFDDFIDVSDSSLRRTRMAFPNRDDKSVDPLRDGRQYVSHITYVGAFETWRRTPKPPIESRSRYGYDILGRS